MRFFKDVHKVPRSAETAADGIDGNAQVLSVGATLSTFDMDPTLTVELLVIRSGQPPRWMKTALVVPMAHLGQLSAGATLPVRISASDPSAIAIDWDALD